jgi:predicted exporter
MQGSRWAPVIAVVIVLCGLGWYVFRNLTVTNEITSFLPEGKDRVVSVIARELAESELARSMILTVEGPTVDEAAAGAKELGVALSHEPGVAWVRGGIDEGEIESVYNEYFPRRFSFWTDRPELAAARLTDDALRQAARTLKGELGSPLGALVRKVAPADPLLTFPGFVERLSAAKDDALHLEKGQFVSADNRYGVLFVASKAAPFDGENQTALLAAIDGDFATVNRAHGGALRFESSGVNRFAVYAEKGMRADVQRISVLSTVGVVVLFLLIFRSIRYVFLGMLPLIAGTIVAMAVGIKLFGPIHGLTLAFGSSLIGVGIDYAEHYFSHYTIAPHPDGPEAAFRHIWPGLVLGALTTVAGLAGLAWTSFPGLREIAVFSTAGVIAALLATRWLVPPFMPRHPRVVPLQRKLSEIAGRVFGRMMRARRGLFVLPVAGVVLCAIGLPRLRWVDDVSALNTVTPELVAEDLRVRERVGKSDPGRFVIALGDNDEQALAKNDQVALRLQDLVGEHQLEGFRSLHTLLWSAGSQERSRLALAADPSLPARLGRAFEAEGFVADSFASFATDLAAAPPAPLTFDALAASPLADLSRSFRVVIGGRVAIVTLLVGVHDGAALAASLADLPDVHYLDQREFFGEAYGRFRTRTLRMIAVGLIVVFAIVHARYRSVRLSLAAFLPCVLAAAATVSLFGLFGATLNLLHLVGLLLVLSMGADYGIFVVESRDHPEELGATLVSLVVAMLSTVLSFGLLGMSDNPALRALGITAGLGTLLSVVFAPAALVLFRGPGDRS